MDGKSIWFPSAFRWPRRAARSAGPSSAGSSGSPSCAGASRGALLVCVAIALGCERDAGAPARVAAPIASEPLSEARGGEGPRFELLSPERTGVHFVNVLDHEHPRSFLYHTATSCGGAAIGDVDGDGRPDVYLVSGPGENRLYRQVGDLRFEDVTKEAGVSGAVDGAAEESGGWGVGVAMVDIDNDRDLDIYVANFDSPNLLYVNDGRGRFTESAKRSGVDFDGASIMASFCDYDLDGDLDFYLLTNRQIPHYLGIGFKVSARRHHFPVTIRNGVPEIRADFRRYYALERGAEPGDFKFKILGGSDRMYRNNGDGTFTDVTSRAGKFEPDLGLSATWWDYDGDGYPDLYVGNDFDGPDHLYHNNGDGTFTDVLAGTVPHTSWFSMGADAADINNDGLLDFLTADMSATTHFKQKTTMGVMNAARLAAVSGPPPQYMRNALYLNTGTERFMEVAYLTGLADTDWTWSVKLADLDNDSRVDLFVTNGVPRDTINSDVDLEALEKRLGKNLWEAFELAPPRPEQNLAFRNRGDLDFTDVSKSWGLDHLGMSYAAAHGDLDRDGDLDLVVVNLDEPVSIYRNRTSGAHRVLIRLAGTVGNRFGVGATVRLESGDELQVRQLFPATGFTASNDPLVHFGLGRSEKIDRLTVSWPSGHRQVFEDLAADRLYTITEPEETPASRTASRHDPTPTLFARSAALRGVRHRERPFDDFARQPLLPNRLSQLGPGMAWGDADSDGDADVYIAGAAGQAGALYLDQGEEKFALSHDGPWREDAEYEDMAALWLDADSDGDRDLLVTSGSVERDRGDPLLADRLYLNDGAGRFSRAGPDVFPGGSDSSGVAVAADFDSDGDVDVFIGGRAIPGEYPLAPASRLLENDGGTFRDVTDELAPDLRRVGMVTGALWSDADGDGALDLLVTVEWGSVRVFWNRGGALEDRTAAAGLADLRGWWNSIAGGDVDADGDIDYAVMNFGLNTKYHASLEKPALLYYGDFAGSGEKNLIEAEFEGETLYPIRGKSCSTSAMPFLGERFTTYRDFALAPLGEIYTQRRLADAQRFEATTLESGVLINDGKGRFEFRRLPRLAQAAPGFGVVLTELGGDGHVDLYLVGNFFGPQPETGRMDGGLGLLLTGNGDGSFTPVWPRRSGLAVPGDAKGLATCDLNRDGWPDLVVTQNDDELLAFTNQRRTGPRPLSVRLRGKSGNPDAVGARVSVVSSDGITRTAEVYAGSGYLSQSAPRLYFGLGGEAEVMEIRVRWPGGHTSSHTPARERREVVIDHP